jgi:hypothetical protein
MTLIRIYNDSWHGAIHSRRCHPGSAAKSLPAADEKYPGSTQGTATPNAGRVGLMDHKRFGW